jgi:type II secretory pathway pseudopilin PulG
VAALPDVQDSTGASLPELLIALALIGILGGLAVPATVTATDEARVRQAAAFLAGRMRLARQDAIFHNASSALVFDQLAGRWLFRACVDGNGNGLRRAELTRGPDRCTEGSFDIGVMCPGVAIAVDATLRGPDNEPGSADPVRLGSSNLASFSTSGTCTSGSVFLRSASGEQVVVRIAGVNARTRILRFDRRTGAWRDE